MAGPEGLDTPVLLVKKMVVMPAHQNKRVAVRFASVDPVFGMVAITTRSRDAATGPTAPVVTDDEAVELVVGDGALLAAVIDDGAERVGDVSVESAIAGHASNRLCWYDDAVVVGADHSAVRVGHEVVEFDGGDDLGPVALAPGCRFVGLDRLERNAGHVDEGICPSLRG